MGAAEGSATSTSGSDLHPSVEPNYGYLGVTCGFFHACTRVDAPGLSDLREHDTTSEGGDLGCFWGAGCSVQGFAVMVVREHIFESLEFWGLGFGFRILQHDMVEWWLFAGTVSYMCRRSDK